MLYRIAGSDAPLLLPLLQELSMSTLTNRQRKAHFNRLSQGIKQILNLKGQVNCLSLILTQSTVEIGVEMTKESFSKNATAGGEAKTIGMAGKTPCRCDGGVCESPGLGSNEFCQADAAQARLKTCTCGTIDGPHGPDCIWWALRSPKKVISDMHLEPGTYEAFVEVLPSGENVLHVTGQK